MRLAAIVLLLWCGVGHAQTSDPAGVENSAGAADSADTAATSHKHKPLKLPVVVFGYFQVHYRMAFATGDDSLVDNDDFRVQRVRIGVKGDLSPKVSYDVEIDPRAPEITGVLRDAFLTLKIIPRHDLRIGQQKTQFGYENRESSTNLYAVNRSDVSDNLSRGVTLRDIGVGLIGSLKIGKGTRIEDAFTVVNGAGMNVQADDTPTKNGWGRLGIRWKDDDSDRSTRVGVSGAVGDMIDPGDDPLDPSDDFRIVFNRYGVDVELDYPKFFFSSEYVSGHQVDKSTGEGDEPVGYYVNLVGKTRWRIGPIVRLDDFDDDFHRWTLGAYYGLPAELLRFMVNYEYRQRKDGVRGDDKLYLWTQVRF